MSTHVLPAVGTVAQARQSKKIPKKAEALVLGFFDAPTTGEAGDTTAGYAAGGIEIPVSGALPLSFARGVLSSLEALGASGAPGELVWLAAPDLAADPGAAEDDAASPSAGGQEASVPKFPRLVLAVGLGPAEALDDEVLRRASGQAARTMTASRRGIGHVATTLGDFGLAAAVEGWILGSYHYSGLNAAAPEAPAVTFVADWPGAKKEFVAAQIGAEAVVFTRDLVNTPANFCYPQAYADYLADTAESLDVKAEVLDFATLQKKGFGGIVAVGQGSVREPRLVRLTWKPKKGKSRPRLALVGKGITFDTGGISLKPARNMEEMVSDMGGSAAAAATVFAAARLNLPVEVTATLALAENMPSGSATRPGDVITHFDGTSSEIINTDAEGRVVLADAIASAGASKPDYLVEISTLTGAQITALGNRTAGVMGSPEFRERIAALGRDVGENAWAMPLLEEHAESVRSQVADLRNSPNSRDGGMLYAATYLSRFVPQGVEWAHVDIAGPSWNTAAAYGYTPKRATGAPVRTLIALIEELAAETRGSHGQD